MPRNPHETDSPDPQKTPPAVPAPSLATLAATVAITTAVPLPAEQYIVDRGDESAIETGCAPSGPPDCTLRGAVINANAHPGPDSIVFDLPSLNLLLLSLTTVGSDDGAIEGDLDIEEDLVIDGVPGC